MSTFSFQNPGEIDIRGAYVAGLSQKSTDNPIGLFGTGLKYAIASILRWQGAITIHSGTTAYTFIAEDITFRDAAHQQVVMVADGHRQPLGFTTHYGHQWEPWQVWRELASNARDEGGQCSRGLATPLPNHTTIHVRCDALNQPYAERDAILLPTNRHIDSLIAIDSDKIEVTYKTSNHLYYRGVRVFEQRSALHYNILGGLTLTEDRTIAAIELWPVRNLLSEVLVKLTDETAILTALVADEACLESEVTFSNWQQPTPQFLAVAERLYRQDRQKHARLRGLLAKHKPELTELPAVTLTRTQQNMLDRAVTLVAKMNLPEHYTSFPITVAHLGESTLGQFNRATGKIYLDPKVFDQGTKQVLSTLYEELIHATTGLADRTYALQTLLFNTIVSLHEEHVFGEPC